MAHRTHLESDMPGGTRLRSYEAIKATDPPARVRSQFSPSNAGAVLEHTIGMVRGKHIQCRVGTCTFKIQKSYYYVSADGCESHEK